MNDIATGPSYVCFDTTALLQFATVGELDVLRSWFPTPFAPAAVTQLELGEHTSWSVEARSILAGDWLIEVPVDEVPDLAYIAYLHDERWHSAPGKNRGEAEVVVLCRRYGWTAIMEDEEGRQAARENGVCCAYMLNLILAAAAQSMLTSADAWKLFCKLEATRRRALLAPEPAHRPAFEASVRSFETVWRKRNQPPWPQLLAEPQLDGVILLERKRN